MITFLTLAYQLLDNLAYEKKEWCYMFRLALHTVGPHEFSPHEVITTLVMKIWKHSKHSKGIFKNRTVHYFVEKIVLHTGNPFSLTLYTYGSYHWANLMFELNCYIITVSVLFTDYFTSYF